MNSLSHLRYYDVVNYNAITRRTESYPPITKLFEKNERKLLKAFLLCHCHKLLCELFHNVIQQSVNHDATVAMESYLMDSKIIQFLIRDILETGEYTLEGIAHYTKIPFDVILDAACGNNYQLSVTPWARIVDLYIQVKPEISEMLFDKLLELKENNKRPALSLMLNEP